MHRPRLRDVQVADLSHLVHADAFGFQERLVDALVVGDRIETDIEAAEVLPEVRPDRLLVESDTPDQGPGGGPSEPAQVADTLQALAGFRGESVEAVAAAGARRMRMPCISHTNTMISRPGM